MLDECAEWTVEIERFRTALTTPAAQTLWRVLVVGDTDVVPASVLRIVAEINDRHLASGDPKPGDNVSVVKASD